MRRVATRRSTLAAVVTAGALAAAGLAAAGSAQAATNRTALPGTKPIWATAAHEVTTPFVMRGGVTARVYLAGRDPAGLAAHAATVSNPKSAYYRRYLTPAQAQQRYGSTPAAVAAVRQWLTS